MEHDGHRERMRERYRKQGLDGFAPHEVLELLLFYAIPRKNVNPLAHALIERFGSLHAVLEAAPEQLMRVEGVGPSVAQYLTLFHQVEKRLALSREKPRPRIQNRAMAESYCARLLAGAKREHFYVVCLNGQMEVLHDALIAVGSLTDVPAYPRVVAEAALNHNAHAVLLCHNHPGGSPIPSQNDLNATARIGEILAGLDIALADHIIVTDTETLSMIDRHFIERRSVYETETRRAASSAGEVRIAHTKNRNTP